MTGRKIVRRIAATLPDGLYIEATLLLRDGSDGLTPSFSVTGTGWEPSGRLTGRGRAGVGAEGDMGGCIHDEILAAFPNVAPLVALHLAHPDGTPMHALANGWYYYSGGASAYERREIENGHGYYAANLQTSDHDHAARALRVAPSELPEGLDREGFVAFVASLAPRYAAEAAAGVALLESLTSDALTVTA